MRPSVSVIISSLDGERGGNVPKLVAALKNQTVSDYELVIVTGEKPCARAHNVGVQRAHGDIIVFFDDDITIGHNQIIANLIAPLAKDKTIGITGASQLVPPDANSFQKRYAEQFERSQYPIVPEILESDMATHAAMSMRRDVFLRVGQENENLIYGDDPDLRARVRQAGYKVVIVPDTWIFHPPPSDWRHCLSLAFQRGKGAAQDFWRYPDLVYETPPGNLKDFVPQRNFIYRVIRACAQICWAIVNFKLIFLAVRLFYGFGYVRGLILQGLKI